MFFSQSISQNQNTQNQNIVDFKTPQENLMASCNNNSLTSEVETKHFPTLPSEASQGLSGNSSTFPSSVVNPSFGPQSFSFPQHSSSQPSYTPQHLEETMMALLKKYHQDQEKAHYFKSLSPIAQKNTKDHGEDQHQYDAHNYEEENLGNLEEKSYDKQREALLSLLTKGQGTYGGKTVQKSFPLDILKKSIHTSYTYLSPLRYLSSVFSTTKDQMTLPLYHETRGVQWNDEKPQGDEEGGYDAEALRFFLHPLSLSRCIPCHLMDNVKGVRSWMETHCLKDLLEEENKELFLGKGPEEKKPLGLLRRSLEDHRDLVVSFSEGDLPQEESKKNALLLDILNKAMNLGGRYNTNTTCWIIHRSFVTILRNLTLGHGSAWTYGPKGEEFLFGRPVYLVDLPIEGFYGVFGDMEQAYATIRHENFYLLVNPYSKAPHTSLHMRYSLGGGILDPKAYTMIVHPDTFKTSLELLNEEEKK